MNNNIKAGIFLLIFILLVIGVTSKIAAQPNGGIKPLGKIPTTETCNCIIFKGFKQTKAKDDNVTIKSGLAVVYADATSFDIGGKKITFTVLSKGIAIDSDKSDMWYTFTDAAGDIVFQNKKTIYYYSPKGKIK